MEFCRSYRTIKTVEILDGPWDEDRDDDAWNDAYDWVEDNDLYNEAPGTYQKDSGDGLGTFVKYKVTHDYDEDDYN